MKQLMLIFLLLPIFSFANADAYDFDNYVYKEGDAYEICTDGGRWQCFDQKRQELALQIAQTNRRLRRLNPVNKYALLVSHKSWERYIHDDCQYNSTFSLYTMGAGYGNMYAECLYRHYEYRLKKLQKTETWLRSLKE